MLLILFSLDATNNIIQKKIVKKKKHYCSYKNIKLYLIYEDPQLEPYLMVRTPSKILRLVDLGYEILMVCCYYVLIFSLT